MVAMAGNHTSATWRNVGIPMKNPSVILSCRVKKRRRRATCFPLGAAVSTDILSVASYPLLIAEVVRPTVTAWTQELSQRLMGHGTTPGTKVQQLGQRSQGGCRGLGTE